MELNATFIPEPRLVFGNGGKHVDPKAGLTWYGPAGHSGGSSGPASITLGFVGPSDAVEASRDWVLRLNEPIESNNENLRLFPPYPGLPASFICRLHSPDNLLYEIPPRDLTNALSIQDHKKKILAVAELFTKGLRALSEKAGKPNLVVFPWSEEIVSRCAGSSKDAKLSRDERDRRKQLVRQEETHQQRFFPLDEEALELLESGKSGWNLHAELKARAMEVDLPIQIILPRTYMGESQESDPSTPWNIATGMYYKAGGIPWRPSEPESTTCYIGIEFFKDKTTLTPKMRTCVAQVFSDAGSGLVLRGSTFQHEGGMRRSPRMDEGTAQQLVNDALDLFERHNRAPPRRVVVHKSSHFVKPEIRGIEGSLASIEAYDLVTVFPRADVQFVRHGIQPALRGMMVPLDRGRFALQTVGYVPYLNVYPGQRIPRAVEVTHHAGDAGPQKLAREILKLTKLNWNSARFGNAMPSTLMYAKFVKAVLAQVPEGQRVSEDYSRYM